MIAGHPINGAAINGSFYYTGEESPESASFLGRNAINGHPLNVAAINGSFYYAEEETPESVTPLGRNAINGHPLNAAALGGSAISAPPLPVLEYQVDSGLNITLGGWYAASRRWAVPASIPSQTIYLCTLEGPEGLGLDPLYLPMSSLQLRLRDGTPSYIGAVIPIEDESILSEIEARDGGTLTVRYGVRMASGTEVTEVLATGTMEGIRYDIGSLSGSATVVAYGLETTTTSKYVELTGVQVVGRYNTGKRTVRCEPSFFLRPGDVAVWDDGNMIVGLASIIVTDRIAYMTLTER